MYLHVFVDSLQSANLALYGCFKSVYDNVVCCSSYLMFWLEEDSVSVVPRNSIVDDFHTLKMSSEAEVRAFF